MRRVIIFSTNYLPGLGGAEIAVKEITARMAGSDFDLITARLSRSRSRFEKIGNVSVHRVGFGFWGDKFFLPFLGAFRAIWLSRKIGCDVIWAIMASYGGIAASFFKIFNKKIPMVLTLQEGDEEEHLSRYVFGINFLYKIFIRPWYHLPFKKADFITAISGYLGERAANVSPDKQIEIVPNGADVVNFSREFEKEKKDFLRSGFGFKPDDVLVLSVSRLVRKNGLSDLIKAVLLLPDNYKLLIVGEGELRPKLEKEIFDLGLSGRVVLAGSVPAEEAPLFMKSADIFARASLSEGFGNVFVEAFASGLPVVATPVGGITDFLEDKETGVFCGVSDPTDIALKIGMVMRDEDLRRNIIKKAKEKVEKEYDWVKISLSMERVFDDVVSRTRFSIVIAAGIYPPAIGGPAKYAEELVKTFSALGHRVRLVKYGAEKALPAGARHFVFMVKCLFALRGADFILALDNFSAAWPAVFAARILGKKSIVRVGGDFLWERYVERTGDMIPLPVFNGKMPVLNVGERFIFRSIKRSFRGADKIVFSSKWLADIIIRSYSLPAEKIAIIENFYGSKEKSSVFAKKNFIWAGRRIKLKNLENIELAFAEAREKNPEIELEIADCSHEELLEKIKKSYATVSVSLSEVSPNFAIESLYCGKPFITTKYCGIVDRLEDVGIYADPLDLKNIAEKIVFLSDEKNYAKQIDKVDKFSFTHSWEEIAEEFLRIIKKG